MDTNYLQKIRSFYENAGKVEELGENLVQYLCEWGYHPQDIMAANCMCSDDAIAMQFPQSGSALLGPFYMGGLNGFPFTGRTGLQAFAGHVPDQGALLIVYGPHIGIPLEGNPGYMRRRGQTRLTSCCGAAIGALQTLGLLEGMEELPYTAPPPDEKYPGLDDQFNYIVYLFNQHRELLREHRGHRIVLATEIMYQAITHRLDVLINSLRTELAGKRLFLAGGIFINTDDGHEACASVRRLQEVNLATGDVHEHLENYRSFLTTSASNQGC